MIPQFAIHARAPLAIMRDTTHEALKELSAVWAAGRPARKPVYKDDGESWDLSEDWSLAARHNEARQMLQRTPNGAALLQVRGMILKDCPFWLWEAGYATSLTHLDAALDMVLTEKCSALIMDINSGGGSFLGLVETAAKINLLKDMGVHATAYTSLCCCSAAYFLASACQEIFASPSAVVGSIGTYSVFVDFSAAAEMAGLKFEIIKAREAPLKAAGVDGAITDEQRADMQRMVDEADEIFQKQVKGSRRGMNLEQVSTGAAWFAAKSPKGMVDDAEVFLSLNDLISAIGT